MHDAISIESLSGAALLPHLDDVAKLRIAVFRDWPYLYEGDVGYEREYLAAYAQSADSVVVLARDGGAVVGASTGLPLAEDSAEFQAPFLARGIDVARVFYCGESVLLPAWRGRGIGHAFFDRRERAACEAGATHAAFCAVVREAGHPLAPRNARDLGPFWRQRGYLPLPGATAAMAWKDRDQPCSTAHTMQFWSRRL